VFSISSKKRKSRAWPSTPERSRDELRLFAHPCDFTCAVVDLSSSNLSAYSGFAGALYVCPGVRAFSSFSDPRSNFSPGRGQLDQFPKAVCFLSHCAWIDRTSVSTRSILCCSPLLFPTMVSFVATSVFLVCFVKCCFYWFPDPNLTYSWPRDPAPPHKGDRVDVLQKNCVGLLRLYSCSFSSALHRRKITIFSRRRCERLVLFIVTPFIGQRWSCVFWKSICLIFFLAFGLRPSLNTCEIKRKTCHWQSKFSEEF